MVTVIIKEALSGPGQGAAALSFSEICIIPLFYSIANIFHLLNIDTACFLCLQSLAESSAGKFVQNEELISNIISKWTQIQLHGIQY